MLHQCAVRVRAFLLVSLLIHQTCPALQWPRQPQCPGLLLCRDPPADASGWVWVFAPQPWISRAVSWVPAINTYWLYGKWWGWKHAGIRSPKLLFCSCLWNSYRQGEWSTKDSKFLSGWEEGWKYFFPYFNQVFESLTFPDKKEVETSSIPRRSAKQRKDVLWF